MMKKKIDMIQISHQNWSELFGKNFLHFRRLSGYYNQNYIIESDNQKYILRIPIPNSDKMDLRIIPESTVLKFLNKERFPAPRLIFENEERTSFVHKYIEGNVFDDLFPEDSIFPDWISVDIANQMKNLHQLDPKNLEIYCKDIGKSPSSNGFFHCLISSVEEIYSKYKNLYVGHFKKLEFPEDPFKIVRINSLKLIPRKFTLCHCDIHRKNLIISNEIEDNLVILDWELALVADPLYDIGTHFHKMKYTPNQEILFLEHYLGQNKNTVYFKGTWDQIQIYLQLEKIKSAIVDIVRMSEKFKSESSEKRRKSLSVSYQNKLKEAWVVWEKDLNLLPSISDVYSILDL
jgi:thiamine kinase-like enzyme